MDEMVAVAEDVLTELEQELEQLIFPPDGPWPFRKRLSKKQMIAWVAENYGMPWGQEYLNMIGQINPAARAEIEVAAGQYMLAAQKQGGA